MADPVQSPRQVLSFSEHPEPNFNVSVLSDMLHSQNSRYLLGNTSDVSDGLGIEEMNAIRGDKSCSTFHLTTMLVDIM